jgi:hypothetical protein
MRRTILHVRPACALALLALLAGAIGVPADGAREHSLAGTTVEPLGSIATAEAASDAKRHGRAHRHREHRPRHGSRGRQAGAATHEQSAPGGNSAAAITGSFTDACRDFAAHSGKDISHVEIHYADGRVVKDESTTTPDYAIDGGAGEEIAFAIVKSGTTRERFDCARANTPPTAILEINGPCGQFADGTLSCDIDQPRSAWTWSRPGNGFVLWGCNDSQFCEGKPTDPGFRGTGSTDPDGDIVTWSIDFGDGTSTGGSWTTDPPSQLVHQYPPFPDVVNFSPVVVTLTVTDASGQTDSDTLQLVFMTPD